MSPSEISPNSLFRTASSAAPAFPAAPSAAAAAAGSASSQHSPASSGSQPYASALSSEALVVPSQPPSRLWPPHEPAAWLPCVWRQAFEGLVVAFFLEVKRESMVWWIWSSGL
jgi:hypothetical protein